MLDLHARRTPAIPPVPSEPRVATRRGPDAWAAKAADRLRSAAEGLALGWLGDSAVDQLAGVAAVAREPDEVRVALVRLACLASGADRAELVTDADGRAARRLASWPGPPASAHAPQPGSGPRGPLARPSGRGPRDRAAAATLQLPLRAGDATFGTLRLTSSRRRSWPDRVVRRLATLCALAAAAERGLAAQARPEADPASMIDPEVGPRGSTLLGAFLGFALAQARRRAEPVALMDVAVDRLPALNELLGGGLAAEAVARVARAIKATVRASDVVVRLEDGRLAVILPNASAEAAARVAEAVRAAIRRAGTPSETMPALTASIGVATFPDHAHDVATLRAGASSALTRAKAGGHDRSAMPASHGSIP